MRSRTLQLVLLLVFLALSLRRVEGVERACEALVSPARHLALLAQPFVWLRPSPVEADDSKRLAQGAARVRAELSSQVLPDDAELRKGRAFVPCEVVARVERAPDRLLVRTVDDLAVRVGDPAVLRDHYLGRVAAWRDGEWEIELVTAREHRVGAVAREEDAISRLVVGGLRRELPGDVSLVLGAHALSDATLLEGDVRVQEGLDPLGGTARLRANGYRLGRLVAQVEGAAVLHGVENELDWEHGLHHLALLVDAAPRGAASNSTARDPLDAARWQPLTALSAGGFAACPASIKVVDEEGIDGGSAVARELRLVGRIGLRAAGMAEVALLGDPACEFEAVGQLGDDGPLLALGSVRGAGRPKEGRARLGLGAQGLERLRAAAQERPGVPVRLWTAGSERGVPAGLHVGVMATALVPAEGDTVLFAVAAPDPKRLQAWRETREEQP